MDHPRPPVTGRAAASVHHRHRAGRPRAVVGLSLARAGAVALAAVLAGGVVAQSHEAGRHARAQVQAVEAADAARAEAARRDRSVRAEAARLEVGFARYAVARRNQALDVARTAVQTAEAVVVSTAADVPAETVSPLDAAAAELEALIAATREPPALVAAADPAPGATPDAPAGAGAPSPEAPVGAPAAGAPAPGAPVDAAGPAAGDAVPDTHPEPADVDPGDPAATDATATEPAPPAGRAAPADAASPGDPATSADPAQLDLAVTAEVLAAAQRVTDLSAQVQAAADAAVAAGEAARVAAEEAARAAHAETARRVAVAQEAPNGQVPAEVLCPVAIAPDALLRCDAAAALDRLADAYRADTGHDLRVVSTYRSFAAQVSVKATRGALAAEPGRSNHGRGLAVDLADLGGLGDFTAPAYRWMKQHAAEFGWHHPAAMEPGGTGPQEPWHWEFDTEG